MNNPANITAPFLMVIAGPTMSGKTVFIKRFVQNFNYMFEKIIYCYASYQKIYDDIARLSSKVEFQAGFPEIASDNEVITLVVIDDLMFKNEKELADYFTRIRHCNVSIMFVSQDFFFDSNHMRTVTRNATYFVIFNSPQDVNVIRSISKRMYPDKPGFLLDAYRQATQEAYSYLFLDCRIGEEYRVKTNIFPGDEFYVFQPKA